ncbi:hypothetical protein [Ferruginibacter sp. SUN106]|uniref:hypothetical protein n=1 Tax=Ferruginibacter sp. SUN106 TaxID=2978348 RepID=UPI003D369F53
MSFFSKLFGKKGKQADPGNGPMPTRPLNLQFATTPANGIQFAQQFVDAVKKNDNKTLNYSVDTIDFVEAFLQRFSNEGLTVNDFAETIFVAGCYVGQVMIINNNGAWVSQEEVKLPEGVNMMPIVIQLPNGNIADPIAKAFKRFQYGNAESIRYFYQFFTVAQP